MPTRVSIQARAKVNLYLWVRARRPDGFHDVESLLASLDLADAITIERTDRAGVSLSCAPPAPSPAHTVLTLPLDVPPDQNLVVRAARAFQNAIAEQRQDTRAQGVAITLTKRIPIGAGLGGGSADAAATLIGMNALHGEPLSQTSLRSIGATLGADVPFCLDGGLARAEGIGDRLVPIDLAFDAPLLLVVPQRRVATAWAYARLDQRGLPQPPSDLTATLKALAEDGALSMGTRTFNSFESVVDEEFGFVAPIKASLAQLGAAWSLLTGSGACVFGVFADRDSRDRAAHTLAARADGWRVLAASTAPRGATIE